jgi:hypothetical protein
MTMPEMSAKVLLSCVHRIGADEEETSDPLYRRPGAVVVEMYLHIAGLSARLQRNCRADNNLTVRPANTSIQNELGAEWEGSGRDTHGILDYLWIGH